MATTAFATPLAHRFRSLFERLLSGDPRTLPPDSEVRSYFGKPLGLFYAEERGRSLDEALEADLEADMSGNRFALLSEFERRVHRNTEHARDVLLGLWDRHTSVPARANIISLALNSALAHGRKIVDPHNLGLLRQMVPDGSVVLDIGSGTGFISSRLRDAGFSVRAFDNTGPSQSYTRYWTAMWKMPEPGWPSDELKAAILQENTVLLFCFPHIRASYPAEIVKMMAGKRVILFPGPDFPYPQSNAATSCSLYTALRLRRMWEKEPPASFYADVRRLGLKGERRPLIFVRDTLARS